MANFGKRKRFVPRYVQERQRRDKVAAAFFLISGVVALLIAYAVMGLPAATLADAQAIEFVAFFTAMAGFCSLALAIVAAWEATLDR